MAAKTKAQIILDINNKIVSNGNIKAVDTNAILKDILDCTELNQSGPATGIPTFSFASKAPLIDTRGAELNYSIRGIAESFANITFKILIKETNVNDLKFTNNNIQIAKALNTIIDLGQSNQMDFLVKIKRVQSAPTNGRRFVVANMSFAITDKNFSIKIDSQEANDNLFVGDQIFTSIAVHCPDFNG